MSSEQTKRTHDEKDELYPTHKETTSTYITQAREIHSKNILIDGHNDLPWALRNGFAMNWSSLDLTKNHQGSKVEGIPWSSLHTDIPRLRQGGVGAQFWSVYIPTSVDGPDAIALTLEQIDAVHTMCERYPDTFEMVERASDVERIFKEGKIASMMGVEGGHQIGGSLRCLRMFYRLGVRYMTLTHNGGPGWADPAVNADGTFCRLAPLNGLNDFGRTVVTEMNRLGMLVDLSHVHHATMHAALDVTKAPVIFSHSSTRALCSHPRDVPDDVLCRLKENGGVVMIVFLSKFVAGEFWVAGGKVGATVLEVADHVEHVVKTVGIDHVGIGGDYDGGKLFARGLEDVSTYPVLTCELLKRGFDEESLGKLLGKNVLRVLWKCENVAKEMKEAGAMPSEERWGEEIYETNLMKEEKLMKMDMKNSGTKDENNTASG